MSAVNAKHLPKSRFTTDEWSINFAESETPQDPMARLTVWEKQRTMGLISTRDMVLVMNPEFTEAQADERIADILLTETDRIAAMRDLQRENASVETTQEDPTPEENGDAGITASTSGFVQ